MRTLSCLGLALVTLVPLYARAESHRAGQNAVQRAHDIKRDAAGFSRDAQKLFHRAITLGDHPRLGHGLDVKDTHATGETNTSTFGHLDEKGTGHTSSVMTIEGQNQGKLHRQVIGTLELHTAGAGRSHEVISATVSGNHFSSFDVGRFHLPSGVVRNSATWKSEKKFAGGLFSIRSKTRASANHVPGEASDHEIEANHSTLYLAGIPVASGRALHNRIVRMPRPMSEDAIRDTLQVQ